MRTTFALASTLMIGFGGAAFAQTTQTSVVGASGDPSYPLQVTGSNGVQYKCENETENRNGVTVRSCVRDTSDGAGVFGSGTTEVGTGAIAAGAVGLIVIAASLDGSDSATTTTGTGG